MHAQRKHANSTQKDTAWMWTRAFYVRWGKSANHCTMSSSHWHFVWSLNLLKLTCPILFPKLSSLNIVVMCNAFQHNLQHKQKQTALCTSHIFSSNHQMVVFCSVLECISDRVQTWTSMALFAPIGLLWSHVSNSMALSYLEGLTVPCQSQGPIWAQYI